MDAITAPAPAPAPAPPAAAAEHDVQYSHLVQRLKGMSTSAPSVLPPDTTNKDASELPATSTQRSSTQTSSQIEDTANMGYANTSDAPTIVSARPTTPRAQTEPPLPTFHSQPRNRSPYSRHLRSHSGSSALSAPLMARAHSLPTKMNRPDFHPLSLSPVPHGRSSSPLRSPKRTRSPRGLEQRSVPGSPHDRYGSGIRPASAGSFEGAPSVCDISEDAELELTPRPGTSLSSLYSSTGSLSRRRRPASPLHHTSAPLLGVSPTSNPTVSTPTSGTSSPLLAPSKFNEQYPSSLTSSSISSTPTSMRSRSPSISSLETIEDSPDAEELAIEEDRIAKLKAAADREDGGDARRSSLDVPEGRGRSLGFGKRDSRKRWSVCGAERRQDLDLETIWED